MNENRIFAVSVLAGFGTEIFSHPYSILWRTLHFFAKQGYAPLKYWQVFQVIWNECKTLFSILLFVFLKMQIQVLTSFLKLQEVLIDSKPQSLQTLMMLLSLSNETSARKQVLREHRGPFMLFYFKWQTSLSGIIVPSVFIKPNLSAYKWINVSSQDSLHWIIIVGENSGSWNLYKSKLPSPEKGKTSKAASIKKTSQWKIPWKIPLFRNLLFLIILSAECWRPIFLFCTPIFFKLRLFKCFFEYLSIFLRKIGFLGQFIWTTPNWKRLI